MDKSTALFITGLGLVGGGIAAASPADELAVTAATGGAGVVAAPVQGVVTGVAGVGGIMLGLALIAASSYFEGKGK